MSEQPHDDPVPSVPGPYPPEDTKAAGGTLETMKPDEERKQALAQQVRLLVAQGARVESQNEFDAVLATGKEVNHVLHAILTLVTCLFWGLVWAVVAATGGVKRQMVSVDVYGHVSVQRITTR